MINTQNSKKIKNTLKTVFERDERTCVHSLFMSADELRLTAEAQAAQDETLPFGLKIPDCVMPKRDVKS